MGGTGAAGTDGTELDDVIYRCMEKVWTHPSVGRRPVGEHRVSVRGVGA